MSDELSEYVAERTGTSRRKFLIGLLAGSAFAAPAVASFTMGGAAPVVGGLAVGGSYLSNQDCSNSTLPNCELPNSH